MLGFGTPKPKRVTEDEMDEIRRKVSTKFDKHEEHDLDMIFSSALKEKGRLTEGISREEFELSRDWLKENPDKHSLEDDDIVLVERYFEQHLKD